MEKRLPRGSLIHLRWSLVFAPEDLQFREVCDILGIEAARQMLFNELTEVMEFADAFINYHHLSLLCDRMTMTKDMVPIFRSGILSDDIGPIAKATFEVHTEVLLDAARHADFDHMPVS